MTPIRHSETGRIGSTRPFTSPCWPSAPVDGIASRRINPCIRAVSDWSCARERRLCNTATGALTLPIVRFTASVFMAGAAPHLVEGDVLRYLALIIAAAGVLLLTTNSHAATQGRPQPALIARISKQVFGPRWRVAACIAHYESTDGAHLYNGSNLGPWQVNVAAHRWVNARRVVADWWYAARVAFRISSGGRDWSPWSTRRLCGV